MVYSNWATPRRTYPTSLRGPSHRLINFIVFLRPWSHKMHCADSIIFSYKPRLAKSSSPLNAVVFLFYFMSLPWLATKISGKKRQNMWISFYCNIVSKCRVTRAYVWKALITVLLEIVYSRYSQFSLTQALMCHGIRLME